MLFKTKTFCLATAFLVIGLAGCSGIEPEQSELDDPPLKTTMTTYRLGVAMEIQVRYTNPTDSPVELGKCGRAGGLRAVLQKRENGSWRAVDPDIICQAILVPPRFWVDPGETLEVTAFADPLFGPNATPIPPSEAIGTYRFLADVYGEDGSELEEKYRLSNAFEIVE